MNTLSETDEGKASPSVWPVYVAAGVVLIVGLSGLAMISTWHSMLSRAEEAGVVMPAAFGLTLAHAAFGLLGVVAAIGMLRLRGWGWFCGIVFAGVWTAQGGMSLLGMLTLVPFEKPELAPAKGTVAFVAVAPVLAILLIVILATRRQLFFPPKPEGEE